MPQFDAQLLLTALNGSNGFKLSGSNPQGNNKTGSSVSAGDINGDGYADLIIGAYNADVDGNPASWTQYGATYVVYGGSSVGDSGSVALGSLNGTNGFTLTGPSNGSQLGWYVANAGDVNADGYDDVITGAYNVNTAYVVFGGQAITTLNVATLNGTNGFSITGTNSFGGGVASAGDFNNDGAADVVVGGFGPFVGLVLGHGGSFGTVNFTNPSTPGPNTTTYYSSNASAFGSAMSTIGDFNGDGYDDFIVGDPWTNTAFVMFGTPSPTNGQVTVNGFNGTNGGFQIVNGSGGALGLGAGDAGDFNADGYADLIVGDTGGTGQAYVLFGHGGAQANVNISASYSVRFTGTSGNYTGWAVHSVGDVNGDGFDDVGVASLSANGTVAGSGAAYIIFGSAAGAPLNLTPASLNGDNGFVVLPTVSGDRINSLHGAGDVNGDGLDDFILGSYYNDTGGTDNGAAYVVFGHLPNTAVTRVGTVIANKIHGGNLTDSLSGQAGNDTLLGHGGADTLQGGADNDSIDGGDGEDTALYSGAKSDYTITWNSGTGKFTIVDDRPTGSEGTDTVLNVEKFSFNGTIYTAADLQNHQPTVTGTPSITLNEDGTHIFALADFNFSDSDAGDTLASVSITGLPTAGWLFYYGSAVTTPGLVISASDLAAGRLTFVPATDANGAAYATFGYTVSDGEASSTAATMTVNVTSVNDAPSAGDNTVTTLEDQTYTFALVDFGFSDIDGNNLSTVNIVSLPGAGAIQLAGVTLTGATSIDPADIVAGKLVYVPPTDGNGAGLSSFTFSVTDDGGGDDTSAEQTMTIDVTSVNDRPSAADGTATTDEDNTYFFSTADFGFSDSDSNALQSINIATLPADGELRLNGAALTGPTVVDAAEIAAGKLSYVPPADENGASFASFTFTATDDGGTDEGGEDTSAVHTITIDVTSVNDAPSAGDNTVTTLEDKTYTFDVADFGFTDSDDNSLNAIHIRSLPAEGELWYNGIKLTAPTTIDPADVASGDFIFVPPANGNGAGLASFTFAVTDDGGGDDTSADRTMTIDVTSVNDPPNAADNTVTTLEDKTYTFTTADFGFSDSDPNTLQSINIATLPTDGVLQMNGVTLIAPTVVGPADITAGKLTYVPPADANGAGFSSFTFTATDNGGTAEGGEDTSATHTVTIDVTSVNDAPSGSNGTIAPIEDSIYKFSAGDFGFSDSKDSPPNVLLRVDLTVLPSTGKLYLNNVALTSPQSVSAIDIVAGNLTYLAPPDQNGNLGTLSFKVVDNGGTDDGGHDTDSVRQLAISVTPVNDAPYTVNLGGPVGPSSAPLTSISEAASTATEIKVADITIGDIDSGTNVLSLSGADKDMFVIHDGALYLKAGAILDFEGNPVLDVTVEVDDTTVGGSPDATAFLQIFVTDEIEVINGNSKANKLTGNAWAEIIDGKAGNDTIKGGGGADTIIGGAGKDLMTGGAGPDVFLFKPGDMPKPAASDYAVANNSRFDRITDFTPGEDVIDLSAIDANTRKTGNQVFEFGGKSPFVHGPAQITYKFSGNQTVIVGDVNGDRYFDFRIVLDGKHYLTADDFIL